jgi:hypothetical protein
MISPCELPAANVPRVSWPCATSGNPNRGWACRGSSRQGARPRRRGRRGENPLMAVSFHCPKEAGSITRDRCAIPRKIIRSFGGIAARDTAPLKLSRRGSFMG